MDSTDCSSRTSEVTPSPTIMTNSTNEDPDVGGTTELERLKDENVKIKRENEVLKLDCESYSTIMDVERQKHQKRCQELEEKIAHLSEAFEFEEHSKGLADVLKKNMEIILVSERELKTIYETQQQMADRALAVHCHLNTLSKRIVDKMDEMGIETDDLEIKELKNVASEKSDSAQEVKSPVKGDTSLSLDASKTFYEEQCKKYEAEIELLKDVISKLTRDKADDSLISNDDHGQIAVLTSRLVMARLTLGELKPAEAYKVLEEANALATYTMADLEVIAASAPKKKKKMTPMKRIKRIFSTKRTTREPMPTVSEKN